MIVSIHLAFAISCFFCGSIAAETISSSKADFDFLLLAQFWPISSCIYFQERGVKCTLPKDIKGWTIHGLWPSNPTAEQPEFCNNSMKFDYSQIESLQPKLDLYWYYYNASGTPTELWSHEWDKHGTCAYSLDSLRGEMNYFNQTLYLHSKLNTFEALSKSDVTPSDTKTYSRDDFFNAVLKYYKYKPNIVCDYDKETHKTYIDQIYLCYDKNLAPRDCSPVPHTSSYFDRCGQKDQIYYLPFNTEILSKHSPKNVLLFKSERKG